MAANVTLLVEALPKVKVPAELGRSVKLGATVKLVSPLAKIVVSDE